LIANTDFNLILRDLLASRFDVDPDDAGVGPKKPLPHLERSAVSNTDLNEHDIGIYKTVKVSFVNGEIMLPL
jgi:hypothetical protein